MKKYNNISFLGIDYISTISSSWRLFISTFNNNINTWKWVAIRFWNFTFYCNFLGIGNIANDYFKYPDKQLNKMWTIHPEIKPYFLGSYGVLIWRKDFIKFRDNFELIGNLKIVDNLDKNGNGSMNASDWTFLNQFLWKE